MDEGDSANLRFVRCHRRRCRQDRCYEGRQTSQYPPGTGRGGSAPPLPPHPRPPRFQMHSRAAA